MSDNFKLDINMPQKKIEEMAKAVIREIVEEKIQQAMKSVNVEKIINEKLKTIDTQIKNSVDKNVNSTMYNLKRDIQIKANNQIREYVIEEVQKKPLSGNIYLKIDGSNVGTDYEY